MSRRGGPRFSNDVARQLGFYVYGLVDPEDHTVFYVGRGTGNRVFRHAAPALSTSELPPSPRLDRIAEIHRRGQEVETVLFRHGLDERSAFEVEAALIEERNQFHRPRLTPLVAGQGHERGYMSTSDAVALYAAPRAPDITLNVLLLRIPHLWFPAMSVEELYDSTRGWWVLGERREKADYAFAVSHGVVREVYQVDGWRRWQRGDDGFGPRKRARWGFDGRVAKDAGVALFRHTDVSRYFANANPVRYVNC